MYRFALAAALALALAAPAAAQAGTYHVYACAAAGTSWANNSWKASVIAGATGDVGCAGGTIGVGAPASAQMAAGGAASLAFTSPAGTTVADFTLSRRLDYVDTAASGTHQYYALYSLGATAFAGAGDYADATRNALNAQRHWYGYPAGTAHVARSTVTKATFPALASYPGNATQIILRVGCYARGTPCTTSAGQGISNLLFGADVTVDDPTPPAVSVEASGLLAGGARDGSDPVTVIASDASGIQRVELIDLTGTPTVVGSEDYTQSRTDANRICDYSLPAPCPALSRETVRPTGMAAGQRQVVVRVVDTGGNVTDTGPYPVFAVTPSDRGPANGTDTTPTAQMLLAFTHTRKTRQIVRYGRKVQVRGRLLNSRGQPITGAQLTLLTRDLRRDAPVVPRKTLTTRADGSFGVTLAATASRLLQFGWLERLKDVRFAANGYLTLKARASARLGVSTHRPRVGRSFTLRGRVRGVSRGGVTVIAQGRPRGAKHYQTFADTTATRDGAFKVRYRFRDGSSRGHRFVFRAKIRTGPRFPYQTGYSGTVTVRVR